MKAIFGIPISRGTLAACLFLFGLPHPVPATEEAWHYIPDSHCPIDGLELIGTEFREPARIIESKSINVAYFVNCSAINEDEIVLRDEARSLIAIASFSLNDARGPLTRQDIIRFFEFIAELEKQPIKVSGILPGAVARPEMQIQCDSIASKGRHVGAEFCAGSPNSHSSARVDAAMAFGIGKQYLEGIVLLDLDGVAALRPTVSDALMLLESHLGRR